MLARFKKIFLFVLVMGLCAHVFAQATFTTTITPSVIGIDETAQLSFTVNNAQQVEQIEPPVLKNFDVVGGPNQQSNFQSINGVTKQSIGVSYIIKPKATGNFTIDEASAKADGKILKSNKVTLKVVKAPQGNNNQSQNFTSVSPFGNMPGFDEPAHPSSFEDEILKEGENVQKKIDKNIFIKVTADKNSCYVGEPIVVTYKLYTRLKAESNITKSPSFNGFSVIDMSQADNNSGAIEKIDGREYDSYTLLKVQLYPLQAGKFDLDPTETDNTIYFIKEAYAKQQGANEEDLLNNFAASNIPAEAVATEHVALQSKPLTITVKDLPQKNKPASFKGAVGDFTITATLEKNKLTTDDDGKLTVVITGNGNMALLNAPEISWPTGIDGFEPKTTESLNKLTVPVSGSKIFEYQFNASKSGDYMLPAIEFSYFDVKSGIYKTISTQPKPLTITQGPGKNYDLKNSTFNSTEKKNSTMPPDYGWFLFGAAAIVISTGLFFYIKNNSKKLQKAKPGEIKLSNEQIAAATKIMAPINPLALTEVMLAAHNSKEFYDTLNKELKTFLAHRFEINPEEINKKRIAEEMDKNGIALATNLKVIQLLDDIEWQLYTPFAGHNEMQEIYERANTIIHSI